MGGIVREVKWSESIALGSEDFVDRMKDDPGIRAMGRKAREIEEQFELRESEVSYHGHFQAKKFHIGPEIRTSGTNILKY